MNSPQAAHKSKIASAELEEQALELRRAGAPYRKIAKGLNCSLGNAHKLVQRGLKRLIERCQEQAEGVKALELDRLDALTVALWPAAMKGNPQSVEKVLKIMERRASMLGTDAPRKTALTDPKGETPWQPAGISDAELDARIQELARKAAR